MNADATARRGTTATHADRLEVTHVAGVGEQRGAHTSETVETADTSRVDRLPTTARYLLAALRLSLGWVFLWAFLDKTFGLGRATPAEGAWIDGGSPTEGFLSNAPTGPFAEAFNSIAGAAWADWLFMIGLAGIGVALILGIGMRIAAVSGAIMLVLMWAAVLPPENNPFMDDHLIYAMVLFLLASLHAGDVLGLGRQWKSLGIVKRAPVLR